MIYAPDGSKNDPSFLATRLRRNDIAITMKSHCDFDVTALRNKRNRNELTYVTANR